MHTRVYVCVYICVYGHTVDPCTTGDLGLSTHRTSENPSVTLTPENVSPSGLLLTGSLSDNGHR